MMCNSSPFKAPLMKCIRHGEAALDIHTCPDGPPSFYENTHSSSALAGKLFGPRSICAAVHYCITL